MECVFCKIVQKKSPAYIVYEDDKVIAFLDKYPQTLGHTQLVPKKHVRRVYEIEDIGNFSKTAKQLTHGIIKALGAKYATWATFGHEIEHAHLWIVPHFSGKERVEEGRREGSASADIAQKIFRAMREEVSRDQ